MFYSYGDCHRLRKLIDMGEGDKRSKETHYDNLWQMVRYCENISDCRRMQQLQYFGEVFDTSKCGEMRLTKCDNCKVKLIMVTISSEHFSTRGWRIPALRSRM